MSRFRWGEEEMMNIIAAAVPVLANFLEVFMAANTRMHSEVSADLRKIEMWDDARIWMSPGLRVILCEWHVWICACLLPTDRLILEKGI